MQLTRLQTTEFKQAFSSLMNCDLPVRLSARLVTVYQQISAAFQEYELERLALIDKLAEKDANGNNMIDQNGNVHMSEINRTSFLATIQEALSKDVSLSGVSLDEFPDDFRIKPIDLEQLEFISVGRGSD